MFPAVFRPATVTQIRAIYNRAWDYKGYTVHVSGTAGCFRWVVLLDREPVFADVNKTHDTPYDARRAAHAVIDQHGQALVKAHTQIRDWTRTGVVTLEPVRL